MTKRVIEGNGTKGGDEERKREKERHGTRGRVRKRRHTHSGEYDEQHGERRIQ